MTSARRTTDPAGWTALLCGALSGSVAATLALVPLAMLAGGLSARVGVRRRERSAHHEP